MYQPFADLLRPTRLEDVVGQEHILGPGAILNRVIASGNVPNLIFYGPSGTGKTTVANIIAKQTNRQLCRLNATTATTGDIKDIAAQLDTFMAPNGILLYLDEIQYFTKKQQQSLLEFIENGKITLIASTTAPSLSLRSLPLRPSERPWTGRFRSCLSAMTGKFPPKRVLCGTLPPPAAGTCARL